MMRRSSVVIVFSSKIDVDIIIVLVGSIGVLVVVYMFIRIIYRLRLSFDYAVACCRFVLDFQRRWSGFGRVVVFRIPGSAVSPVLLRKTSYCGERDGLRCCLHRMVIRAIKSGYNLQIGEEILLKVLTLGGHDG